MFKSVFTTLLVLTVTGTGYAEDDDTRLIDPMRPPAHAPTRPVEQNGTTSWNLNAILVSPQRRLALINNRLVGVGGLVNGARVKSIHGNAVELELNGKSMTLRQGTHDVRRSSE